ncbi:MAG: ABC transporter ATP-binding protein, partial [Methanosphaera stadtmanae]|nr:ABC transporter ATP-binding protein [Methanosphaera stadtmanae]
MINLNNVSFDYQTGNKVTTLQNINLNINKGELILLCGESGSGKTTITRLINGLIPNYYKGIIKGEVSFNDKLIEEMQLYELSEKIGSVFQNPRSQFFNVDTTSELAFECENLGLPIDEIKRRIDQTVKDLHIENLMDKSIFNLSGGEKQKIACASITTPNPDVFVLDEPSSNLDMEAIATLRNIIKFWKDNGKTIIIAEHRIYYLVGLIDKMVYLKKGKIEGIYSSDEIKKLSGDDIFNMGVRPFNLNQIKYQTHKLSHNEDDYIKINKMEFEYTKNNPVLSINPITFSSNSINVIIGLNGAGKTTFARCLCGLQKNLNGEIYIEGNLMHHKERLKKTYMVMQDVNYQLFTESVLNELFLSMGDEDVERAEDILESLNLLDFKDAHPMSLSGGQKQRVAIACAIASKS